MNNNIKINISIAGRNYPLTIYRKHEEQMRKAGKDVNEALKKFESSYAVDDKQDVLAMCALQFASRIQNKKISKRDENEQVIKCLKKITEKVQSVL